MSWDYMSSLYQLTNMLVNKHIEHFARLLWASRNTANVLPMYSTSTLIGILDKPVL